MVSRRNLAVRKYPSFLGILGLAFLGFLRGVPSLLSFTGLGAGLAFALSGTEVDAGLLGVITPSFTN